MLQVQLNRQDRPLSYQQGATVLCYEEELLPGCSSSSSSGPHQPHGPPQALLPRPCLDTEGSSNSEGSQDTGDSGRYSHDETEMTNLSSGRSSRPPSLSTEESAGSEFSPAQESDREEEEEGEQEEEEQCQSDLKLRVSAEMSCHQYQTQHGSQPALSLCV